MLKLSINTKKKASTNLKSRDGKLLISSLDEKLKRWKSYFEEAAKPGSKVDDNSIQELIPPTYETNEEETQKLSEPISKVEILQALKNVTLKLLLVYIS